MKVVILSDTHGRLSELGRLSGDVLIHCGDILSGWGYRDDEIDEVDAWFGQQRFPHILCVGGNHDFSIQLRAEAGIPTFHNAKTLEDQSVIIEGLRFYGAPWVPQLPGHAYHLSPEALASKWNQIPADTDVLITHTPPKGIRDQTRRGQSVGCAALRAVVQMRRPRLHCFGHVHHSFGETIVGRTRFVNAALENHPTLREPVVVELSAAPRHNRSRRFTPR